MRPCAPAAVRLVVGQELQALELVSFDRALPSEEGIFEDVRAGIVATLRRHRNHDRDELSAHECFIRSGVCITTSLLRTTATCAGVMGRLREVYRMDAYTHTL